MAKCEYWRYGNEYEKRRLLKREALSHDSAVALGFIMLATTFFQSINRPVPSIIITVLRHILFLIPFIYILPLVLDVNGIFFAQPISDLLAPSCLSTLYGKRKKDESGTN